MAIATFDHVKKKGVIATFDHVEKRTDEKRQNQEAQRLEIRHASDLARLNRSEKQIALRESAIVPTPSKVNAPTKPVTPTQTTPTTTKPVETKPVSEGVSSVPKVETPTISGYQILRGIGADGEYGSGLKLILDRDGNDAALLTIYNHLYAGRITAEEANKLTSEFKIVIPGTSDIADFTGIGELLAEAKANALKTSDLNSKLTMQENRMHREDGNEVYTPETVTKNKMHATRYINDMHPEWQSDILWQTVFGEDDFANVGNFDYKTWDVYKNLPQTYSGANDNVLTKEKVAQWEAQGYSAVEIANHLRLYAENAADKQNTIGDVLLHKHLTDDEKYMFVNLWQTEGRDKAEQYLNSLRDVTATREAELVYDDLDGNWFKKRGYQYLYGLKKGLQGFEAMGYNSDLKGTTTVDDVVSGKIAESELDENGKKTLNNYLDSLLISTGQATPSMAVGLMPGVGVPARILTTIGTSGGNAMIEARREGKSYDESLAYGLATGISEAGLETVLSSVGKGTTGLAGKAGGKVVANATKAFAKAHPKIAKLLTAIGTHGGRISGDFVDEYSQEILNPVFRNIIFDENNEVKLFTSEALEAGILGAVMSGVYDGFASSVDFATGKIDDAKAIKALTNAGHTKAEAKAILDAYKSLLNDQSYHEQVPDFMKAKYGDAITEPVAEMPEIQEEISGNVDATAADAASAATPVQTPTVETPKAETPVAQTPAVDVHKADAQSGDTQDDGGFYTREDIDKLIADTIPEEIDFESNESVQGIAYDIIHKALDGKKMSSSDIKAIAADKRIADVFNTAFGTDIDFTAKGAKTAANKAVAGGFFTKKGTATPSGANVGDGSNQNAAEMVATSGETTQSTDVRTTSDNNTAETSATPEPLSVPKTAPNAANTANTANTDSADNSATGTTDVTVGDVFKDAKTGGTVHILSRDENNTTVAQNLNGKTVTRVYTNTELDKIASNKQYEKVNVVANNVTTDVNASNKAKIDNTHVEAGEVYTDNKTEQSLRIVSRDAVKTTVEVSDGAKTWTKTLPNAWADTLKNKSRYTRITTSDSASDVKAVANDSNVEYNNNTQTENENGEIHLRKGGEWNNGENTGKPLRIVEKGSGRNQSGQTNSQPRDSEAASLTFGEKVSTASFGIGKGSTSDGVYRIANGETTAMKEAKAIAKKRGLRAVFFGGGNMTINGTVARGYISGDRVFLRVDDPEFTADQIMRHEEGHDRIAKGEINLNTVKERLGKIYGDEAVDFICQQYIEAYEGANLTPDGVFEEMVCDSLGDMNIFDSESEIREAADSFLATMKAETEASMQSATNPDAVVEGKMSRDANERRRALRKGEMVNNFRKRINWTAYYQKIMRDEYNPDYYDDGEIAYMSLDGKILTLEMQENGEWSVKDMEDDNYERFEDTTAEYGKKNVGTKFPGERKNNGFDSSTKSGKSFSSSDRNGGVVGESSISKRDGQGGTAFNQENMEKLIESLNSIEMNNTTPKDPEYQQMLQRLRELLGDDDGHSSHVLPSDRTSKPLTAEQKDIWERVKKMTPMQIANMTLDDADPLSKNKPKKPSGVNATTGKESKFYGSAMDSDIFAEDTKQLIKNTDDVRYYYGISNEATLNEANDRLNLKGETEKNRFLTMDSQYAAPVDVAEGFILLKRYQDKGMFEDATIVAQKLREMGTKAGQTTQIFSILGRMTPEGMAVYAQKELDMAREELIKKHSEAWVEQRKDMFSLSAEEMQTIKEKMETASKLPDGREKTVLIAEIATMLQEKLPKKISKQIQAYTRVSMLLNSKTMLRNIIGNATMMPVYAVEDFIGATFDKALALKTGVRTKGNMHLNKATGKAALKGVYESFDDFRKHVNTRNIQDDRFEIGDGDSFKWYTKKDFKKGRLGATPFMALSNMVNAVDRITSFLLDFGDRPFFEFHFTNSINNQLRLNHVTEPTADMIKIATTEALQRTWQDNNAYTKMVSSLRNFLNFGKSWGIGSVIVPFTKTPANLTKAIVDYSPVGLTKAISYNAIKYSQSLKNKSPDPTVQKAFVDSFAKGVVGTIGYFIAVALAKKGLITGGDDDKDRDLAAFEKNIMGIAPYSVVLNGKSYSYDWAQPVGSVLAVSADYVQNEKSGKTGVKGIELKTYGNMILNALSSGGNVLFEQSFLQGISELFGDDGLMGGLVNAIAGAPTQFTPTALSQIAQMADPYARTSYAYRDVIATAKNKVMAKIPGKKDDLAPVVDVLGHDVLAFGGNNAWYNVMLNPTNMYANTANDAAKEIYRVYEEVGTTTIIPRVAPYYIEHKDERYTFTPHERALYQKAMGSTNERIVSDLINTEGYTSLDDIEKAEVLALVTDYSTAFAKNKYLKGKKQEFERDSWMVKAEDGPQNGISTAEVILAKAAVSGINKGLPDKNGETYDNSKGLLIMEAIYTIPNLSNEKRMYLFGCFGVGNSVIDYSSDMVESTLSQMRAKTY